MEKKMGLDFDADLRRGNLDFLHITKTGGSAIEAWGHKRGLRWGRFRKGLDGTLRPPHGDKIRMERHHCPPQFFETDPFSGQDVFAVCRHPFTRAISEFRCPWKGFCAPARSAEAQARRAAATAADLNAWLMAKERRGAMRPPFKSGHLIPQVNYFFDGARRRIPQNRMLRYEQLEQDFELLCKEYGLPYAPLPRVNASSMPHFDAEDLEPATKDMLRAVYALDFSFLGYM